ncbi:MAG: MATE family efflux transporter [Candidatus Izemoplasmatales bacterium]
MEKLEKNIYKLTWPIFIELLFFTLLGTVDTIMLSHYSDTAVGSVGISNQILFLFGILVNILAMGIGVVSAQYLGAKKVEEAKESIVTGIIGNLIVGIILSLIVVIFARFFLILIDTDPIFLEDSITYLKIVGFSIIFISLRVALSTAFRSFSKPKVVMNIMIVGNITNIIVNAILIYGLFGAPSLGVEGAAIGTLSARIVMVILLIIYTYKKLDIQLHKVQMHLEHLKKILWVGVPSAAENFMWNIAQVIIVYIVNNIGPDAIIARTYILTLLSYIYIFSLSVANGNAIIVGYYIGEKNPDAAYKHTLKALKIAFSLVFTVTVLLNIFARPIIGLFTDNETIITMARNVLYFAVIIELGRSMNLVFIQALRSVGDTVFPVIMAVLSMFGILVALSYVLGLKLGIGIVGVFMASMFDENIRGLAMWTRWHRRKWYQINLINE